MGQKKNNFYDEEDAPLRNIEKIRKGNNKKNNYKPVDKKKVKKPWRVRGKDNDI